jgi:Contractile injection system tape measure protein
LQQHIIHKIKLSAAAHEPGLAFDVQQKLRACLEGDLQRRMDALLSSYDTGGAVILLDKIVVDTGSLPYESLEKDFAERYIAALREELDKAVVSAQKETPATNTGLQRKPAATGNDWYKALFENDKEDTDEDGHTSAGSVKDDAAANLQREAAAPGNDWYKALFGNDKEDTAADDNTPAAPVKDDTGVQLQNEAAASRDKSYNPLSDDDKKDTAADAGLAKEEEAAAAQSTAEAPGNESYKTLSDDKKDTAAFADETWIAGETGIFQKTTQPGSNIVTTAAQPETDEALDTAAKTNANVTEAETAATTIPPAFADEVWDFSKAGDINEDKTSASASKAISGDAQPQQTTAQTAGENDKAGAKQETETTNPLFAHKRPKYVTGIDRTQENENDKNEKPITGLQPAGLRRIIEAFIWFLEKGSLPWWLPPVPGKKWRQAVAEAAVTYPGDMRGELIKVFAAHNKAVKRWILQLPAILQLAIAENFAPGFSNAILLLAQTSKDLQTGEAQLARILSQLVQSGQRGEESIPAVQEQDVLPLLMAFWPHFMIHARGQMTEATLQTLISNIITNHKALQQTAGNETTADAANIQSENPANENKTIYTFRKLAVDDNAPSWFIRNAGLVILHPFIKILFSNFELLDETGRIKESETARAVHILHYCATGQVNGEEYEMLFNKILCGLKPDEVIARDIVISEKEKAECDHLLQTVINYWTALKGTTPNGLRGTFILREGKLVDRGDGWLLQVEQKTMDILLGQLPWGLSMVRFPWMQQLLTVEWS